MGITPAIIGAGAAVAGTASNIFGGGSGGGVSGQPQGSQTYIPQFQSFADSLTPNTFGALSNASNVGTSQTGLYENLYNQIAGNPYGQEAINIAQFLGQPGGVSSQVAGQQLGTAGGLDVLGNQAVNLAPQIINTAFDPQTALYNQLYQSTLNAANAANAGQGLTGPAAVGSTNQALTNFNLGWQNNLLGRQVQGVDALGNLTTSAGRGYSGAQGLQQNAITNAVGNAQLPYQVSTGQDTNTLRALQALTQGTSAVPGSGSYGNTLSLYDMLASYLGRGQAASGVAANTQQAGFNQNQVLGQNLATALTNPSLSQLFGGQGTFGGTGGSYSPQSFFGLSGANTGQTGYGGYSFGPLH